MVLWRSVLPFSAKTHKIDELIDIDYDENENANKISKFGQLLRRILESTEGQVLLAVPKPLGTLFLFSFSFLRSPHSFRWHNSNCRNCRYRYTTRIRFTRTRQKRSAETRRCFNSKRISHKCTYFI